MSTRKILQQARIRGFRSLYDLTFRPDERLSLLIGDNAVGKSSVLEALQFVSDLVRDGPEAYSGRARGNLVEPMVRLQDLLSDGRDHVSVELRFSLADTPYQYDIQLAPHPHLGQIVSERLVTENRLLVERSLSGARILRGQGDRGELVPVGPSPLHPVLSLGADEVAYPEVARAFRYLVSFALISPIPAMMRGSGRPDSRSERPDRYGADLATRLFRLQNVSPERVGSWLGLLEALGWTGLKTPTANGRVEPRIHERGIEGALQLAQSSDGSLVSAHLAALAVDPPEEQSLLLIDEPAGSTYRNRHEGLAEMLWALASRCQVVVTTHQRDLIEHAGNAQNLRVVERNSEMGTSIRNFPLEDALAAESLAAEGMGEAAWLVTRRLREGGP